MPKLEYKSDEEKVVERPKLKISPIAPGEDIQIKPKKERSEKQKAHTEKMRQILKLKNENTLKLKIEAQQEQESIQKLLKEKVQIAKQKNKLKKNVEKDFNKKLDEEVNKKLAQLALEESETSSEEEEIREPSPIPLKRTKSIKKVIEKPVVHTIQRKSIMVNFV